jgi:CRP-like cAMP-binding protein
MYVISQGSVDLDFGDDLVAKRLGAPEFFGELGLLIGDHARSADATVSSPAVLSNCAAEFETWSNATRACSPTSCAAPSCAWC